MSTRGAMSAMGAMGAIDAHRASTVALEALLAHSAPLGTPGTQTPHMIGAARTFSAAGRIFTSIRFCCMATSPST
jgi:hypothetical protein